MFPDAREMERRASAFERLPWAIPVSVVMQLTDADLDELADVGDELYWTVLNRITVRIVEGGDRGEG